MTRARFARVIGWPARPADLDLDLDMASGYGLTSLSKVIFLTEACGDTEVSLSSFTEADVAGMRTLRDVVTALVKHEGDRDPA